MKSIKTELHIEWEDDATIEIRYFPSIRQAKNYIKRYKPSNYTLYKKS